jgi:Xaa-Pro aminopeptidase
VITNPEIQNKKLMPTAIQITEHRKAQVAAKTTLEQLAELITPWDSEQTIATKAHELLIEKGYPDTWYYDCPALVLLGGRSCLSISGREYQPSNEIVGLSNLITIDLSPTWQDYWGDCARTFIIENGVITTQPQSMEFKNGTQFLRRLHAEMVKIVRPTTTFGQLFDWANVRIRESGFVNLDYKNNVGHSIAPTRDDRQYIQTNNEATLGEVPFFSFEPFVRLKGGNWGFKHENIFFFNSDGVLEEL